MATARARYPADPTMDPNDPRYLMATAQSSALARYPNAQGDPYAPLNPVTPDTPAGSQAMSRSPITGATGSFTDNQFATQAAAPAWTPPAAPAAPAWQQGVTDQMLAQSQGATAQDPQRNDALYNQLVQRAQQSLQVNPNDPNIKGQTDVYRAEQERASRNDLADLAEKSGPYANLRGEQRMAAEHAGQNTAGFQADLMQRELASRREEISQALSTMGSLLSADQQRELQREMALIDQSISQQQLAQGQNAQTQDWQKALMANQSFLQQLGLQAEDRSAYYDAVRRGLFNSGG